MKTTERLPLEVALAAAEAFRDMFPRECYSRWMIAGSIRRGSPWISDVDHVVIPRTAPGVSTNFFDAPKPVNLLWLAVDRLVTRETIRQAVDEEGKPRWGEKMRAIEYQGLNHEIHTAADFNWGDMLAIRTGPWELSRKLVGGLYGHGHFHRGGSVRDLFNWRCHNAACKATFKSPRWASGKKGDFCRVTTDKESQHPLCPMCGLALVEPLIVPCRDEREFFALAGVPFVWPEERGRFA